MNVQKDPNKMTKTTHNTVDFIPSINVFCCLFFLRSLIVFGILFASASFIVVSLCQSVLSNFQQSILLFGSMTKKEMIKTIKGISKKGFRKRKMGNIH